MSKEIIDAIGAISDEKAIPMETLINALEAALLSAYKKASDSAEYARVEINDDTGDFVVWQLLIPEDIVPLVLAEVEEDNEASRSRA